VRFDTSAFAESGLSSQMPKTTSPLVHPYLVIFIQRHIASNPRWSSDSLAWKWHELYGRDSNREAPYEGAINNDQKRSVIDQWLRVYHRLSPKDATRLLDMLDLRDSWERFVSSPQFLREKAGVFNFYSRALGVVEELDLETIKCRGINIYEIATQVVQVDVEQFSDFGSIVTTEKIDTLESIFVAHPETWRVFVGNGDQVLAFWMFVNLSSERFGRACRGDLPDIEITQDTFKDIKAGDAKMYGPTVCVKKSVGGFDKKQLGAKVMGSFLYSIARLENEGIVFSEICTVVASEEGRRWVEQRFGLEVMPKTIGRHLADLAGWAFRDAGESFTPALYYGRADDNLRRMTGLVEF
jgi:hypothetical protein